MKTMPKITLRCMRRAVEFMLTRIQSWEDRHADVTDYRMTELGTGLWQASQSMKALIEGDFDRRRSEISLGSSLGGGTSVYAMELLSNAPVPLRPAK